MQNKNLSWNKNKSQIDGLVNPVLSTVRKNKIHSYIQLKNIHKPFQQRSNIFQVFENVGCKTVELGNKSLNQKFSSLRYKNDLDKYPKTAENKQTTNPQYCNNFITNFHDKNKTIIQNKQINPTRIFKNKTILKSTHTPTAETSKKILKTSKIMRHLVQGVDFQQMQKNLYKKRQCITRYDYFMQQKNSKIFQNTKNNTKSFSYHQNIQTLKNSIILTPTINKSHTISTRLSPKPNKLQIYQGKNQTFRTPRKKFWHRQQLKNSSRQIRKFSKMSQNIKHIEGKSLRKI